MVNIYKYLSSMEYIYLLRKKFIDRGKYLSNMDNIFLYGIFFIQERQYFSSRENNLSRRDKIYPQRKQYFPGEINFDPFSKKKDFFLSLTGLEPATVEKSG
jgi:hypothetical protein